MPNTFSQIQNSCQRIREKIQPNGSTGCKKTVSQKLFDAINDIIAACESENHTLVHQLLQVKELITTKNNGNAFWEEGEEEPRIQDMLNCYEYAASKALNEVPTGVIVFQGVHIKEKFLPEDTYRPPTLLCIEAAKTKKTKYNAAQNA